MNIKGQKGLVLSLPLTSGSLRSIDNINDATPYENNATNKGCTFTLDRKGHSDNAVIFDGLDDWIDVGAITPKIKSISFWCKPDSISVTEEIIDLNGTQYIKATNGTLSAEGFTSPMIYVNGLSSNTITTDWQLITITTETAINASDVDIGRLEGSTYFAGKLSEIKFYNRVLSSKEAILLKETYAPSLISNVERKWIVVNKNANNAIYFEDPDSNLYGKTYFYVMKYQARNNGGVPQSTGDGLPWTNISQLDAIQKSKDAGYHLITNWEWMAIARDIEQVADNWTGGAVGSGMIKRGNVGTTDDGSYDGADPETGILNDKAKLKLSNGEEIYHFSGNVWEWVDETKTTTELLANFNSQSSNWYEYNGTIVADFSKAIILPYSMAGPKAAHNSANGVGKIYVDTDASWSNNTPYDNTIHAFLRGGYWNNGANAGVFALYLNFSPSYSYTSVGFRCAR